MADAIRVLYVDDEPGLLDMGKLFLEQDGQFSVEIVTSAFAALTLLNTKNYDAIISDYQMPEMDGINFLKKIRTSGSTIPFILFTGRGREEIVIQALNEGADFYLQKGGEPMALFAELAHKIRQAVIIRRTQSSLAEQEQRYHDLQNANDLIQSVAPDGHFLFVNKKWLDTLGFQEQDLPNLTIFDIIDKESLNHCMETFQRVISGENVGIIDAIFRTREGRRVYVQGIANCKHVDGICQFTRGIFKDVTEQKKMDAALRESEAKYRNVVEDQTDFISRFQPDGTHVFVNDAYCRYYHKMRNDIIGKQFVTDIPEEDRILIRQHFASLTHEHPVATITHRIIMPDGQIRWQQWSNRAIFDDDGHLLEYQSVGRDITDLKEAEYELLRKNEEINAAFEELTATEEELQHNYDLLSQKEQALRDSEVRFRTLIESSPIAILVAREGRMVYGNTVFYHLTGVKKPETIKDKSLLSFIAPEYRQQVAAYIEARQRGEPAPLYYEAVGLRSDGTRLPFEINVANIHLSDGTASLAFIKDISARKQAEEELMAAHEQLVASEEELRGQYDELARSERLIRESEEKYRTLFNNTNDEIYIHETLPGGMPGKFLEVNDSMCSRLGYTREELLTMTVQDIVSDEHRKKMEGIKQQLSKTGKFTFYAEHRRKDGSVFPVEINVHRFTYFGREIVLAAARDITGWKQVEDALRKSEKKYRDIIDNMQDVVYRTDREGKLIMFSPHGVKLAGYDSEEEMLGFNVALDTYLNPEDREQFLATLKEKGSVENYPLVLKARYGIPRQVTASSHFYFDDDGNVLGVEGILHDITDISKKEQELRASEERYRALYNDNPIMLFTLNPEGKVISVNHAGSSQLGYTDRELEAQSVLNVFYPDDRRAVTEQLQICLKSPGEGFHWQFRKVRKDGRMIWVDEYARAIVSSEGDLSVLVVCQDITDRKTLEDELRLLKVSVDRAADEVFWLDFEGNILYVNDSACRITGYSREEFLAMKIFELDPDFNREIWDKTIVVLKEKKTLLFTTRHRCKDGSIIDVEIMSVYVNKDDKEYSFAFVRDISWRKKTERALIESEKRSRLFLQSANDAIFIHEISKEGPGRFIEVNDQACRMLGYSREELLGMSIPDIDVPEQKEHVTEILEKIFSTGNVVFQTEFLTKDGGRIPVEDSNRLIDLDGRPAVLCIARDLTEQRRTEKVLQATNRKLNLLNNITRHDILNKITVLSGYISLAKEGTLDPTMAQLIEKMEIATDSIGEHVEFTRVYQDLGTTAPQWQDLIAVLPRSNVPKNMSFFADLQKVQVYGDPILEKVFFNLLDNTLRHGKHAKTITVSTHESSDGLIIVWEDDGIGIPVKEKEKIFRKGYGENTGLGLFLSKEILSITGISICETGEPGEGARFEITVPKGAYRFTSNGQE